MLRNQILGVCRISVFVFLSLGMVLGCAEGDGVGPDPGDNSGNVDGDEFCEDKDDDGYLGLTTRCARGTDCDDLDKLIHPGATEVCGDDQDNDCSNGDAQCERECLDTDGDGYGVGGDCLGADCDETNSDIHGGAAEICGNEIDENCDGFDDECPVSCSDADGDGYGVAGANSDCPGEGDDCDDTDASINPGAEEVCNGGDDNCDGQTDECDRDGASCSGTSQSDSCVVGIGQQCGSDDECAAPARCDTFASECRYPDGESCNNPQECLDGYTCQQGTCSGEFCDINTCTGDFDFCFADAERCVECDPADTSDAGCSGGQTCSYQGFCSDTLLIADSDPVSGHPEVDNDIYAVSLAIADCWIDNSGADEDQLCQLLYLGDDVGPITEDEVESAFEDGNLNFIDSDQHEALDDLWGAGFFNVKNINWRDDPEPGSFLEYCIWYDVVRRDEVIVDKCSEYSP